MSCERDVVLVHVHGDPELRSAAFGDADVVEVPVREDEGFDVVDRTAELPSAASERLPGGGNAGVDKGQSVIVFEQVEVGERVFDPVHSRCDVGVQGHADDPEEPASFSSTIRAATSTVMTMPTNTINSVVLNAALVSVLLRTGV